MPRLSFRNIEYALFSRHGLRLSSCRTVRSRSQPQTLLSRGTFDLPHDAGALPIDRDDLMVTACLEYAFIIALFGPRIRGLALEEISP